MRVIDVLQVVNGDTISIGEVIKMKYLSTILDSLEFHVSLITPVSGSEVLKIVGEAGGPAF